MDHDTTVELLINRGVDPNIKDKNDSTALNRGSFKIK
jgi:hypothetical protein